MAGLASPLRGHFAGLLGDDADLLCLLGVKKQKILSTNQKTLSENQKDT